MGSQSFSACTEFGVWGQNSHPTHAEGGTDRDLFLGIQLQFSEDERRIHSEVQIGDERDGWSEVSGPFARTRGKPRTSREDSVAHNAPKIPADLLVVWDGHIPDGAEGPAAAEQHAEADEGVDE